MSTLDRREFLAMTAAVAAPPPVFAFDQVAKRHLALYIYTRPYLRQRHVEVVRKAIDQRAKAHTSGWRIEGSKPVHQLGPVKGNARHFRGDRITNTVSAAWPSAAVLEYDGSSNPKAYLDWFRRKQGSRDPGAWFLDPAGTYVDHINAETVCHQDSHQDKELCYMAVVDTPTGDVIGSNEFAVRARVDWDGGPSQRKGWWIRFQTPSRRPADLWSEEMLPLVDWQPLSRAKKQGITRTGLLDLPARELAVWGTSTVFRFPEIPPGIRPCGGFG